MTTQAETSTSPMSLIGIFVMALFCASQIALGLGSFRIQPTQQRQLNDITQIPCSSHTALVTCNQSCTYFKANSITLHSAETSANHLG
jgi:hypothetical protein